MEQPKCPTTDEWIKEMRFYIYVNIIQPWKRRQFVLEKKAVLLFATNGGTWRTLYAKLNTPDTERQILHEITYVECTRVKLIKEESRMMVARGRGWGKWGGVGQRVQSFSYTVWIRSGYLTHNKVTIVNNTVLYFNTVLKFAKRADLKYSYHKKR